MSACIFQCRSLLGRKPPSTGQEGFRIYRRQRKETISVALLEGVVDGAPRGVEPFGLSARCPVKETVEAHAMASVLLGAVGALLLVAGTVFALQGFGVLGGSSMSGSSAWATAGPVIAAIGLLMLLGVARSGHRHSSPRR